MTGKYLKLGVLVLLVFVLSCNGGDMTGMEQKIDTTIKSITGEQWQGLKNIKIFFAHQSVGGNILDGLKELRVKYPETTVKILRVNESFDLQPGAINHTKVGKNYDPISKIKDFQRMVEEGVGNQANIAFFKFCYIDFSARSDVEAVFERYKAAMLALKNKYPQTVFMHATVPLLKVETGPKAWIKKLIGRTLDGTADNVKRCEFNERLISEFGGRDPIFDIARFESTRPDGSRETFHYNGKEYFAMYGGYTSDGGHLNQIGSKYLASQLLRLLAEVGQKKR